MYDCIVESHESTRQRVESSPPKNHEDHIAGKGFTSTSHNDLAHKFTPRPQAMTNSGCKSRSGQGMEDAPDNSSTGFGKEVKSTKGGSSGSTKRQKESPLCHTDGDVSPQKMRRWNQNYTSTEAESCSGWTLKDDSEACAVSTEQGSSASQMTAGKKWMLLQDYQVVTDKQLMQYLPALG